MSRSFFTLLVVACSVSACSVIKLGPDYQRPALEIPGSLPRPVATGQHSITEVDVTAWWKYFEDPVLEALLQEAQAHNQQLAQAGARIAQARALVDQGTSSLYPTVDLEVAASRQRNSQNSATPYSTHTQNRQIGLSASYEIDFWGQYARADEAARANLLGATAYRATVLTTLYAYVAQGYFNLLALDTQLAWSEKLYNTRTEYLRLQQQRFDAGLSSEMDLRTAQADATSAQASLQQVRQNREHAQAALTLLLGRNPAQIIEPIITRGKSLSALYATRIIAAQLPADILNRRPDLINAEQALIAANADIGQARASYFPSLSLTAGAGKQASSVAQLMQPASVFWSLLGNLTQPIFRAGGIGSLVAAANARQQQALAQYLGAVQSAFRDVHDALADVDTSYNAAQALDVRMQALQTVTRLAELRLQHGYSSRLEVLNAQRDLAQAQSTLAATQLAALTATISLYKAVGGGWDPKTLSTQSEAGTKAIGP